uniref:Uncharacterized protein n=1 Tax=Pleurotus citrinopileatus TaxID=98342 RepID=A0A8D5BKZ5_PLECI|nr:hypothetical protein [Pleurotus citrinopileatus]
MKAHALANPQQLATPIDTSPPRSTPPLYSPKFPPSPTLIERHPSTWIEEILVSVERRRANLKSELIDAKADVNEALAQSFRALTMLKEMIGSGGLVGLLEVLEKEDNEMRERENEKRMAKGKAKAKITEDVKKNAADAAKEEKKKGSYLSLLRLLVRMVGLTMVRRMIMDARESTVRHHGDFDDGEDDDEERDGGSEGESEDEGGDDDDNEGGDGGGHGGGDAGDDGDDEEEEDGGRDEELSDGDGDTHSEPSTNNVSKLQDDVDASSPTKTPE